MTPGELAQLEVEATRLRAAVDVAETAYRDALLAYHPLNERLKQARLEADIEARVQARLATQTTKET